MNNAQWPMLWPTPYPMTTTLHLGGEGVAPVAAGGAPRDRPAPNFLPPAGDPELPGFESLDTGTTSGYGEISSVDRNPQTGEVTVTATNDRRYPLSLGHRTLPRDHRAPHLRRPPGEHRGTRHAPHGGHAGRPRPDVGSRADLHAATSRTSTTATRGGCSRTISC